ncbi:hypothetical protein KGO5_04847 [Sinorhizobium sp. KGO-5]|jgi:hypothetical protein|nr:hypothetical protein KGO5_04847 [Sinorhizobium sp. KGO-5]
MGEAKEKTTIGDERARCGNARTVIAGATP